LDGSFGIQCWKLKKQNMKKLNCSLLALSITLVAPSIAQVTDSREVLRFGAKAGFNISNVWDSKGQEFQADPKAGIAAGLFAGLPIGKFFGLQPEIMLSRKGFKGSGTLLGSSYSFSRTTTFLDIPLQVQLKPVKYIKLLAGPQFSYLLNQKNKYTFGTNSIEQEKEFNNDNARKYILGFTLGGDLIYEQLVLFGRLGWDFQANNGDGTTLTPRYKNQWIQFTVGIQI
jgi:hypothetical protein